MEIFHSKTDLTDYLGNARIKDKKIGFSPTMGALHDGHLSLIRASKLESDISVCSIFINPVQFNNEEDLQNYPRTLEDDLDKLLNEKCDAVYVPQIEDIYVASKKIKTNIHFGSIENILEGSFRPGHFKGVGLIVSKFFNIIKPDYAYFGQKDLQQYHLIKQLIEDLSYEIKLRCISTVRESDGLALSSRNARIKDGDRPIANSFYEALIKANIMLKKGYDIPQVKKFVSDFIGEYPQLSLEYFEVIDIREFSIIENIEEKNKTALCISGYLNNIRLIDNVFYI